MAGKISRVDIGTDEDGLSAFLSARARLFGIAYRVLRSAAEAEDIVQDVWIRWQTTERSAVRNATAFLATTTTRLAINVVQSARSRRETAAGPSLGESLDTGVGPERQVERREALQGAVCALLGRLSPAERAAYVLREVFAYRYREIASLLRLEEANARQLVTRARQHLVEGPQAAVRPAEQRRLVAAIVAAFQQGALSELEGLLSSSGRGTARTARATARRDDRSESRSAAIVVCRASR
jgi:RNA polymerase sigma-70 factor (ECF subfamily)